MLVVGLHDDERVAQPMQPYRHWAHGRRQECRVSITKGRFCLRCDQRQIVRSLRRLCLIDDLLETLERFWLRTTFVSDNCRSEISKIARRSWSRGRWG